MSIHWLAVCWQMNELCCESRRSDNIWHACKHFIAFCPTFTSIFISFVDCAYLFLLVVLKFYSEYHLALIPGTIVTFLNVIS